MVPDGDRPDSKSEEIFSGTALAIAIVIVVIISHCGGAAESESYCRRADYWQGLKYSFCLFRQGFHS